MLKKHTLGGGYAWKFLFNFSKVKQNAAFYNDKTINFFHIFSDVAIGSQNLTIIKLKYQKLL